MQSNTRKILNSYISKVLEKEKKDLNPNPRPIPQILALKKVVIFNPS